MHVTNNQHESSLKNQKVLHPTQADMNRTSSIKMQIFVFVSPLQARFQQKQMQEKEEKLLRLYENQQQRAFDKVSRGSAGSNSSMSSTTTMGGKVRQMFDERRQKAGIDKSYPLEPLKTTKPNGLNRPGVIAKNLNKGAGNTRTIVKTTVQNSVSQVRNGNTVLSKNSVKHSIYNNNGGEERYQERIFENNNGSDAFFNSQNDLIAMMNNHNLAESLDNERLPDFGFDEIDDVPVKGKLANLGGKLPSQNGFSKKSLDVPLKVEKTESKPYQLSTGKAETKVKFIFIKYQKRKMYPHIQHLMCMYNTEVAIKFHENPRQRECRLIYVKNHYIFTRTCVT